MYGTGDSIITQCPSVRVLTPKDYQWTIDLYGTDYLTSTVMPCDLAAGHKERHIHQVIRQYLPGDCDVTWWASWNESEGDSYALFDALACSYYNARHDRYCEAPLHGHEGPHVFPTGVSTVSA